jgi:hypothetical protein
MFTAFQRRTFGFPTGKIVGQNGFQAGCRQGIVEDSRKWTTDSALHSGCFIGRRSVIWRGVERISLLGCCWLPTRTRADLG